MPNRTALNILLVDDDAIDRMICLGVLRAGPWEIRVDEAECLSAAKTLLATKSYDCVLLDRHLPDGDGKSLLPGLNALAPPPAIVFITGQASEESGVIAIGQGAQDYVSKHRLDADLLRSVRYALQRQHLEEELRQANVRLEALSQRDPLSGLLNRRGLEARLVLEARRAERDLTQIMALVIDVDKFKSINDRYGHDVGDGMLTAIARQMEIACRATDHCARVGGDEFLVLLPAVSLMEARNIAERLRMLVHAIALPVRGMVASTTVSIAVTDVPADVITTSDILAYTRFALLQCKQGGRDRVSIASTGRPQHGHRGDRSPDAIRQNLSDASMEVEERAIVKLATGELAGRDLRMISSREGGEVSERALFAAALNDGRLVDMDLAYLRRRLAHAENFEDDVPLHLAIFADTLLSDRLDELALIMVGASSQRRIVLGLDVNLLPRETAALASRMDRLRAAGARFELLDVGAGGDAVDAVLALKPEFARLSVELLATVHQARDRRMRFERMCSVLRALACHIIADGVDLPELRVILAEIGVPLGMGPATVQA